MQHCWTVRATGPCGTSLPTTCARCAVRWSTQPPPPPYLRPAGLCLGSPILLEGPPGSGKSALIEHVPQLTGNVQDAMEVLWTFNGRALQPFEGGREACSGRLPPSVYDNVLAVPLFTSWMMLS